MIPMIRVPDDFPDDSFPDASPDEARRSRVTSWNHHRQRDLRKTCGGSVLEKGKVHWVRSVLTNTHHSKEHTAMQEGIPSTVSISQ